MGKTTLGKLEYTENVKNLHTANMPNQRWEFCEGTYNLGWYYPEVPKYFALVAEITPIKPHKISPLSANFSQNVNGPVQINLEFQKHFFKSSWFKSAGKLHNCGWEHSTSSCDHTTFLRFWNDAEEDVSVRFQILSVEEIILLLTDNWHV